MKNNATTSAEASLVSAPAEKMLKLIRGLVNFPNAQICVHAVSADLLSALAENGYPVSRALARAVVGANDASATRSIEKNLRAIRHSR